MDLRIVFVTPEEPSVIPPFFDRVIPEVRSKIVGVAVVRPIYRGSTWRSQAMRFIRSFGLWEFLRESSRYFSNKVLDLVKRTIGVGRFHSIKSLTRHHGLTLIQPVDVNDPSFLSSLRDLSPDLIVSVSCPQIFKKDLLELPRLGCVNVHSALLPDYRGMLPTFWVLANEEKETGVTVHYMTPGIDGGDILAQRRVPIAPEETLHSLMMKTKQAAADLVLETIRLFEMGAPEPVPNDATAGGYYSFPKREDVMRFKALGRRLR